MRGLASLIYRYHVFLVFVVLQALAFSFLVQYNQPHSSAFINSTNGLATSILEQQAKVQQLLKLQEANDSLALELAMMKSHESDFYEFFGNDVHEYHDSLLNQHYRFTSARVVNASFNKVSNYITINKGSSSGIKPEMAVLSNNSVVGLVKDVSENFSSVMPLINRHAQVSAMVKGDGNFGLVKWDVTTPGQGFAQDIPKQAQIQVGDTLVTSGFGTYYPPNVMVGTIGSAEVRDGDSFYTILVDFATDFTKMQYVDVVENLMKEEQIQLEQRQEEADD